MGRDDYSLSKSFYEQLCVIPVHSIKTKNNEIFICKRSDKLIDVWKGLIRKKFHSVPVMQETNPNIFYGAIDLHDISNFIVSSFSEHKLKTMKDFWAAAETTDEMKKLVVDDVIKYPLTNKNPYHPVTKTYSLFSALEILAREPHLQRLPIIDENRKLVNMLTLSRVIEFFHQNKNILGNRVKKPLSLLASTKKKLISIKQSQKTIDAFKAMKKHKVSSVAVVDDSSHIVGVISETDLKLISPDAQLFYKLFETADKFLDDINANYKKNNNGKTRQLITVSTTDTIGSVIDLLYNNKVHRVYIVNPARTPVGVVSVKDLLVDVICN